jgi:hypothetical protein
VPAVTRYQIQDIHSAHEILSTLENPDTSVLCRRGSRLYHR